MELRGACFWDRGGAVALRAAGVRLGPRAAAIGGHHRAWRGGEWGWEKEHKTTRWRRAEAPSTRWIATLARVGAKRAVSHMVKSHIGQVGDEARSV